jgi:hypothetical protein
MLAQLNQPKACRNQPRELGCATGASAAANSLTLAVVWRGAGVTRTGVGSGRPSASIFGAAAAISA